LCFGGIGELDVRQVPNWISKTKLINSIRRRRKRKTLVFCFLLSKEEKKIEMKMFKLETTKRCLEFLKFLEL
jgi:hypothetical protein